jgi:hypothetical protein
LRLTIDPQDETKASEMITKCSFFTADSKKNRHGACRHAGMNAASAVQRSGSLLAARTGAIALAIAFLFAAAIATAVAFAAAHALAIAVALAAALVEVSAAVALVAAGAAWLSAAADIAVLSEAETACHEQRGEDGDDGFRFHVLVLLVFGVLQERMQPSLQ